MAPFRLREKGLFDEANQLNGSPRQKYATGEDAEELGRVVNESGQEISVFPLYG